MRTITEISAALGIVESDERLHYKTATIVENAPLALIQLVLETKRNTLKWVLEITKT